MKIKLEIRSALDSKTKDHLDIKKWDAIATRDIETKKTVT